MNINDAIFFKLDNFSIFSARSHSSSCEVFHGAKILFVFRPNENDDGEKIFLLSSSDPFAGA